MIKPRFAEMDEDELARIMDFGTSDNTNKVINMAVKVQIAYCLTKKQWNTSNCRYYLGNKTLTSCLCR